MINKLWISLLLYLWLLPHLQVLLLHWNSTVDRYHPFIKQDTVTLAKWSGWKKWLSMGWKDIWSSFGESQYWEFVVTCREWLSYELYWLCPGSNGRCTNFAPCEISCMDSFTIDNQISIEISSQTDLRHCILVYIWKKSFHMFFPFRY